MEVSKTLYGHTKQKADLLALKGSGRLPHALLVTGAKGIGKATFCTHIAHALLGGGQASFSRMISGAHADFLTVSPLFDEKTEEQKREITVEQAREIPKFLSLTSAESAMRVVVVDSADDLNTNSANAILKILEEPPANALLMLVSHNPASLLPTIRSRCQTIYLSAPEPSEFRDILLEIAPEIGGDDAEVLGAIANYAPGLALHYHMHDALSFYSAWREQMESPNASALQALADRINSKQRHTQFELAKTMLLTLLSRLAKGVETLSSPRTPKSYANAWFAANEHFSLAANAHLDYKSAILSFAEHLKK